MSRLLRTYGISRLSKPAVVNITVPLAVELWDSSGTILLLRCSTLTVTVPNCFHSVNDGVASVLVPNAPAGDWRVLINPYKGGT